MASSKSKINNGRLKSVLETTGVIIGILGVGFGAGKFYAEMNHKLDLMNLQQEHNAEITNLKLEYNQRLIESNSNSAIEIARLQNELNSLKTEMSHGK